MECVQAGNLNGRRVFAGFIIDFVSGPVSSGFTSAVAIIIVSTQVKDILGITAKGSTFISIWTSVFDDIHNTRLWDPILGVLCIIVLLLMRVIILLDALPVVVDRRPVCLSEN